MSNPTELDKLVACEPKSYKHDQIQYELVGETSRSKNSREDISTYESSQQLQSVSYSSRYEICDESYLDDDDEDQSSSVSLSSNRKKSKKCLKYKNRAESKGRLLKENLGTNKLSIFKEPVKSSEEIPFKERRRVKSFVRSKESLSPEGQTSPLLVDEDSNLQELTDLTFSGETSFYTYSPSTRYDSRQSQRTRPPSTGSYNSGRQETNRRIVNIQGERVNSFELNSAPEETDNDKSSLFRSPDT